MKEVPRFRRHISFVLGCHCLPRRLVVNCFGYCFGVVGCLHIGCFGIRTRNINRLLPLLNYSLSLRRHIVAFFREYGLRNLLFVDHWWPSFRDIDRSFSHRRESLLNECLSLRNKNLPFRNHSLPLWNEELLIWNHALSLLGHNRSFRLINPFWNIRLCSGDKCLPFRHNDPTLLWWKGRSFHDGLPFLG